MARTAGTGQQPRACGPGRGLLGSWRLLVEAPPWVLTALPHPPSLLCAPPWSPGLEPPGRVSCLDAEGVTGGGRAKPAGSTHLAGTGMGRPPPRRQHPSRESGRKALGGEWLLSRGTSGCHVARNHHERLRPASAPTVVDGAPGVLGCGVAGSTAHTAGGDVGAV